MNELTCAIIKQINRSEFGSVKGIEMDKYLELKEKFEANRDDENAVKMAAYMRNLFSFYPMRRKTFCFSYGDIRRVHRIYASN